MYCWGNSTHHELHVEGLENSDLVMKPTMSAWREAASGSVRAVWAGEFHALFLTAGGALLSGGSNELGQLGRRAGAGGPHAPQPVDLPRGARVVAAACGAHHSLALDEWGQPYAWGSDCFGQLGTGSGADSQDKPKIIKTLATLNVVQIACGSYHSLALTSNGEVWSWGANSLGQCGLGTASPREAQPQRLASLHAVPLQLVAAGGHHSLALSRSGAVFCWGKNTRGQLGLQDRDNRFYPSHLKMLRNAKVCHAACGEEFTAFLTLEGGVFTCGAGEHGQTGHGSAADELVPRRVLELMGSRVTQLAAGRRHLLARVGPRLLGCGHGARGQLGCPGLAYALLPAPVPVPAPATHKTGQSEQELKLKRPKTDSSAAAVTSNSPPTPTPTRASTAGVNANANWASVLGGAWGAFAGGDHSFVVRQCARADHRQPEPAALPLTLTLPRLQPCAALGEAEAVPQELMAYLETVLGSPACMNGSFLVAGDAHYGCGPRRHGVDLAQAHAAFGLIARVENATVRELVLSLVSEQLVAGIRPSPADAEALRVLVWLPLYHELRNGRRRRSLHAPLAQAYLALAPHARRLADAWWGALPAEAFDALVDAYKAAVVLEIAHPTVQATKKVVFSTSLVQVLNLLAALNKINFADPRRPLVPAETFYIEDLCTHIDIAADYINWLSDQDCVQPHMCNYAFVFDVACKAQLLRVDQTLQMQLAASRAAQQGLVRLLLEPGYELQRDQFLQLVVSREHLVRDAVQQISAHDSSQLKKPLRVQFVGEEAEDAGGVRKEFFLLLLREILDPVYGMFVTSEETRALWFSGAPLEDDSMYYLIGAIFGLAIYNSIIIYVPFPPVLYKKLLGEPPQLDDLLELQPTLAHGLRQLLQYEGDDVEEAFGLVFAANTRHFDQLRTHELRPGGAAQPVTQDNRHEYVDLYVDFLLNKSIESQFSAFHQGFQKVCGGRIIKLFRPLELMAVVIGSEAYDWAAFEAAAHYKPPYSARDPEIRWFWEVFHDLPLDDKKKFLLFLTGSDRVPVHGMKELKIYIQPVADERYLPVAHTCFNLLDLPRYRTKERLRYCLQQAIQQTQGFSLV